MANRYWVGGTGTWDATTTTNWSTASGGSGGASVPGTADIAIFDSASNVPGSGASYTVTRTATTNVLGIRMANPSAGTLTFAGSSVIGVTTSGLTITGTVDWTNTGTLTFAGTTAVCNTGTTTITSPVVINGTGITTTLNGAFSTSSTLTLTAGTLSLSASKFTAATANISGTTTRTFNFSTGDLTLTGSGTTIFNATTQTGLVVSGTPVINCTYAGSVGTRTIASGTNIQSFSFNFTAGTDTITFTASNRVNNLNFTGFGGTVSNIAINIYGSLTLSSTAGFTMTAGTNTWTFASTTSNKTITTNGVTMDFPISFLGSGGVWTLQDALTIGSSRLTTLSAGTLYLNDKTLTTGSFLSSIASTRAIAFGSAGVIVVSGTGSVWNTSTVTGLTITGTSTVNVTNSSSASRGISTGALAQASTLNFNITGGTGTIVTTSSSFKNLNFTGFAGAWSTSADIIYGNLTLGTGQTVATAGGPLTFAATSTGKTITTNGVAFNCPITFNGTGGGWTLSDALNLGNSSITLTAGAFNTANYSIVAGGIDTGSGNATRSITLGTSTVTLSSQIPISFNPSAVGFTFSGSSSTINCTYTAGLLNFVPYGQSFGTVTFSSNVTGYIIGNTGTPTITFVNLNIPARTSSGISKTYLYGNITVTGTLTVSGGVASNRNMILTDTSGTTRTITAAAVSLTDCDFQYITVAGAATWSGTRLGDVDYNSGITFTPSKTVYWNLAGSQNWSAIGWAASSSGTPNSDYFPLPQDTATFTDAGSAGTVAINASYYIGSIVMSGRTSAMTLGNSANQFYIMGDFILGSGVTISGTGSITFISSVTGRTINTAGKTITQPFEFSNATGGWTLAAALTSSNTITHTLGTLDLNNYVLTCTAFASNNTNTRTLAFGTGRIDVTTTATATVYNVNATGLTVTGTHLARATGNATTFTRTITITNATLFTGTAMPSISVTAGSAGITLSTTAIRDFNTTGSSGAITIPTMTVYGDFILAGRTSLTSGGNLTFAAATTGKTVNTNGLAFDSTFTFNGVGGGWTLAAATQCTALTLTNGSLNTAGFATTCSAFTSSNTNTRSLSLGATTFSCSGNWDTSTTTGLTFDAGTSVINMSSTTAVFNGGGLTYYNFQFTSSSITSVSMYGTNSFFNFITYVRGSAGLSIFNIFDDITVRNNLTLNSGATSNSNRRSMITGYADSTSTTDYTTNPSHVTTITANAVVSIVDVDFRNITAAGASGTWTGTRLGDCGGNSNITTTTPKTVYAYGTNLTAYENLSWSTSSGNPTGVNATNYPLPQDTAVIDDSSGLGTLKFTNINFNIGTLDMSTRTLTISGFTIGGTTIRVYGDLKLFYNIASVTSYSIYFNGQNNQTITNNFPGGVDIPTTIAKYDGTKAVTLGAALSTTGSLNILKGGFNSAGFAVSCSNFTSSTNEIRSISFGASTVTLSGNYTVTGANVTFDAGTSTISMSSRAPVLYVDANTTFYNISITNTTLSTTAASLGVYAVNTAYTTFYTITCTNNFTIAGTTAIGCARFNVTCNLTVGGTFTINNAGNAVFRLALVSYERISTITAAAVGTLRNIDFVGITVAGAAGTWSGTSLGNGGRNSNITFTAAKTVYWNLTGSARDWSSIAWAATSAGTPDIANFPLAQDTVIFTDTGITLGSVLTINSNWFVGTIDYSARTTASTLLNNAYDFGVTGALTLNSTTTPSGTGRLWLLGDSTQNITTATQTITWPTYINCSGTVKLLDSMTNTSTLGIQYGSGTFDLNGFDISVVKLATFISASAKTFNMGSGSVILRNTAANPTFDFRLGSNLTVTPGTSAISTTGGSNDWYFYGGGYTYNNIVTGASAAWIYGNNVFNTISNSTQPATFIFEAGSTTSVNNFSVSGTAGNLVGIISTTNGGQHTISKSSGTVDVSYCSIRDSIATGGATWNALTSNGNVDGGNNTGWLFGLITFVKNRFLAFFN